MSPEIRIRGHFHISGIIVLLLIFFLPALNAKPFLSWGSTETGDGPDWPTDFSLPTSS